MHQRLLLLIPLLLILTACTDTQSRADTAAPGVPFPADYQAAFVHYARVDRADGTIRNLYISPHTLDALRRGQPLPQHTVIVIEGYHAQTGSDGAYTQDADGRYLPAEPFDVLHVIEKRPDWSPDDFGSVNRSGEWNFGSFANPGGAVSDENLTTCFNCHNGAPQADFIYSRFLLERYAQAGLVQYFYCELAGRIAC